MRYEPSIAVIFTSNPSVRIGISGVWNGFFITASAYASYTRCSVALLDECGSASEVRSTNFVPVQTIQYTYDIASSCGLSTGSGEEYGQLEGLGFDDLCAR